MYYMDTDVALPGGDDFRDVTQLFVDAAAGMEPGSMIVVDGFQLQDAMSAIEIGEPRLDTGMKLENDQKEPFHPLTPLLPEEVCWIIDRAFAYEIEWHSGNTLSHTVFTLQYVHSLQEIDPDLLPYLLNADLQRPIELITVVLRAFVSGLLKCCDLSWRELARGSLHDTEDWHSEKCEVSLLEQWPIQAAQARLDNAISWLSTTTKVPAVWSQALKERLQLRKSLLELMDRRDDIFKDQTGFQQILDRCQHLLHQIRSKPSPPDPSVDSAALRTFDPYISRRLNTFLPIRVIELPGASHSWDNWSNFVGGCAEWLALSHTHEVAGWELVANLRVWLRSPPLRHGYVRSSIQTAFHDGIQVLYRLPSTWLLQRFFLETLGLNYIDFASVWGGPSSLGLVDMERALIKTLVPHVKGMWFNPPRRRRLLANSLLEWHMVYDMLVVMVDLTDSPPPHILKMPSAALLWRLSTMREVVLSGFQLELYNPVERPFAYLYASQIIEEHLETIDDVKSIVPTESQARTELEFQQLFLTALQGMCMAMFSVLYQLPTTESSWITVRESVLRRYKWAFKPEYDDYETPPLAHPCLETYVREVYSIEEDVWFSPSDAFQLSRDLLEDLLKNRNAGGWADGWRDDRLQLIQGLSKTCVELGQLRKRNGEDVKSLKWDMGSSSSPWFPSL
ncbi:N-alpha-acetyltransferase, non-catalitic subunit [Marasmius tenuissimus]|nr:N-alpha-acetyltransferase, non-catalitic subunit [Marasmius tenuissimus]